MAKVSRRQFLHASMALAAYGSAGVLCPLLEPCTRAAVFGDVRGEVFRGDAPKKLWKYAREGYLYARLEGKKVVCGICPNGCVLAPGDRGVCRSRVNVGGRLFSIAYGNAVCANVDPVEKKPLYHFMPRATAFSIAAAGCNLRCLNCQNWEISQERPEDVRFAELFPADAVKSAVSSGSPCLAYTYSEPVTFYEYVLDTATLARKNGIRNLLVSNGYINTGPLLRLCAVMDAANINLKSFSDDIYRRLNGGRLQPVLNTLKTLHEHAVHLEITNLVVPGYTDDEAMVKRMCSWIVKTLGPDHPLHFLRFFPRYKLDRLAPTPVATLSRFRVIAMEEGLRYVYVGNVPGHEGNNTYCHACRKLLMERKGYLFPTFNLDKNRCPFCRTEIPGVWG